MLDEEAIEALKQSVSQQDESFLADRGPASTVVAPRNSNKNVYFGDLHSHTNLSFDSYLFGNRLTLDQAYRFAQGHALETRSGELMQLSRPLDFVAITDHAEGFGMELICSDESVNEATKTFCKRMESPGMGLFFSLRRDGTKRPPVSYLGNLVNDPVMVRDFASTAWLDIAATADRHNQPGKFTAFAAYEYSPPLPDRGKIHRNVIFQNSTVPNFAPSAFDALTELDLWAQLDEGCSAPCAYMTIPHNPNKSWGLAFAGHTIDGDPYSNNDWRRRQAVEPIVEMFQIKGNSECSLGAGTTDEECAFEQFLPRCEDGQETKCIFPTSMARDGLKKGLRLEEELGFNPLAFGMIGSSDTHNSNPGDTEEWDFRGSNGLLGGSATYRIHGAKGLPTNTIIKNTTGGLAAVWAEQNSRDHLFNAMLKKEVYATSGTRIQLRFFGGFNLNTETSDIAEAYQTGVPMGATLPAQSASPSFMILALQDPMSAPLDKIQIVKGWSEDGETHEQVFDVACSDGRSPNPESRRCEATRAKVDLSTCSFSNHMGAAELQTWWTDVSYKPDQNTFYYARVIENPTCRYSTFDSIRIGQTPRADVPATVTEMAWSSPIWIQSN